MYLARKYSHLCCCFEFRGPNQTFRVDVCMLEFRAQFSTGFIIATSCDQRDVRAECGKVHCTVSGAAWNSLCLFVTQYEDRGFTRDTSDRAIQESISNCVAYYYYLRLWKSTDDAEQSFLKYCSFVTQSFP